MLTWKDFSESEKMTRASQIVSELTEAGLIPTGKLLGDRIGTTDRTGRTYLQKVLAVNTTFASSAKLGLPKPSHKRLTVKDLTVELTAPGRHLSLGAGGLSLPRGLEPDATGVSTAFILPDWQVGMHDPEIIEKSLALAEYLQPDKIVHVGDESDCTSIGRWARGTKVEWESNLQAEIDQTHSYLKQFREVVPHASFQICFSNHMKRFTDSIETRLPGFRSLRALTIESLYGLDELDITMEYNPFELYSDVIAAHGHQFGLTSAGQYQKATQVVARAGKSLVAGHTHRPVLTSVATGYNANMDTSFYMNVGCAMDFDAAAYISSRQPEWGFGLGVLRHSNGVTYPELLIARDRTFYFEGRSF